MIIRLVGDGSSYQTMLTSAMSATRSTVNLLSGQTAQISDFTNRVTSFGQSIKSYAQYALSIVGLSSAFGVLQRSISMQSEFEKNEVAFGTMLQSMEKGKILMGQLQKFAAETPLELPTLQSGASQLLQAGIEMENIIPVLRMLGDTASGDAQNLRGMVKAFSDVKQAGRLMGGEVWQFTNAGFNPLQEMAANLAKTLGGDVNKHFTALKQKMEAGQISFNDVVLSFQRATSAGGRFAGGMLNASKTLDGLFSTLKDDIGGTLREIGKQIIEGLDLKQILKDVSSVAQAFTDWIKGLDAGTKSAVVAVGAITIGFGLLTAAILVAGTVFNTMFSGIGIISGTIIALFAGAALSLGSLAVQMGGIGKVWEYIKVQAAKAWDWLLPVRRGVTSLFMSIYAQGVKVWGYVKDAAVSAWKYMFGDSKITWDQIRGYILEALVAAQFGIENFQDVAKLAWAAIQYYSVMAGNEITFMFTDTIPAALDWLAKNWVTIFKAVGEWQQTAFGIVGENLVKIFQNIPWDTMWNTGFIGGGKKALANFAKAFKAFHEGLPQILANTDTAEDIIDKALGKKPADRIKTILGDLPVLNIGGLTEFKIPMREIGDVEQKLKDEYEKMGAKVGESYKEFRDKKLKEWTAAGLIPPGLADKMQDPLLQTKANAQAAGKAIHDALNPANWFSAEAITKLQKYADAIAGPRVAASQPRGRPIDFEARVDLGQGGLDVKRLGIEHLFPDMDPAAQKAREETVELLKKIQEALNKQGNKPPIVFEEAGLGGV